MDEIVTSLKRFKETKELLALLRRLDSFGVNGVGGDNMAMRLLRLYKENLIDRCEFLSIRSKIAMGQYSKILKNLSPDLKCGIYLYETEASRVWNASVGSLPEEFNEYTQGLDVAIDVPAHSLEPVYTRRNLVIENVERSEHPVVVNHKQQYLQAGIHSFVTVPLRDNGQPIGHQLIVSPKPRHFLAQEIALYREYSRLLVKELASVKSFIIQQVRS